MARFPEDDKATLDKNLPQGADDPESPDWDRRSTENRKLAQSWKTNIELAERRNEVWEKRCDRIVKRYRDERVGGQTGGMEQYDQARRMNILWSNVQTLKPSIYSREPMPVAERRFLDKDVIGRAASQILERALRYEMSESGFHDTVDMVVQDYLLVGRGTAWLRYKPLFGPATSLTDRGNDEIDPTGDEYTEPTERQPDYSPEEHDAELSDASKQELQEKLLGATVDVDYVHWKDFFTAKARFWKENEWVARRVYMSRQDCVDAFGKTVGKEIPLEMTPEVEPGAIGNKGTRAIPEDAKKAIVYEIWFKPKRLVYFIAKGYEFFLEKPREDPLGLEGFWPCPRPLYATMTNDTLEPVPDYIEYQDQALEIDSLTNRIDSLIKALKVAGVYNAAEKQIARLLDEGHENQLIPVNNWAAFAEKGGIASAISFLPIKEIADVLGKLFEARDKIKNDLYEITGIADIMRGQADPRETARAITTKGKWGSLRLQQRQTEVARFCRDIVKMMGEIISDHYPDQTLIQVSGIMYDEGIGPEPPTPPPPPGAAGQAGPPALPPPGSAPPGQGGPGALGGPPQGGSPQGPPPQMVYAIAQMQYHQALQAQQAAKMAIVTRALALLRQDKLRGFRIDIETDSTINDEAKEEKGARVEFLSAMSQYIEKAMQAAQMYPEMLPLLGKSLMFTVRGFRVGRDLESSIEEFIDKAEQDAKKMEGQPKPPSPEQIKANADMQMAQASLQEAQMKAQADQARAQAEIQAQQIEAQSEAHNLQVKQQMQQVELQIMQFEAEMKRQELQQKAQYDATQHQAKMQQLQLETRAKLAEYAQQDRERSLDRQDREHEAHTDAISRQHEASVDAVAISHAAALKSHDAQLKMRDKHPRKPLPKKPTVPTAPDMPESPLQAETPPHPSARKAPDGKWYLPDPARPGKYLRVDKRG